MPLYLQTRSTGRDYDFLGKRPLQSWWSAVYGRFSALEEFTLALEVTLSGDWRAYLGGIPSERRDSVGTPIRYSLAGAGVLGDRDASFVYTLLSTLLQEYTPAHLADRLALLGTSLDARFPQAFLDGLGKDWYGEGTYEESLRRLYRIADDLEQPDVLSVYGARFAESQGAYLMGKDSAAQWLGLTRVLLGTQAPPQPLQTAILNLTPDPGEIRRFWQSNPRSIAPLLFILEDSAPEDPLSGLLFTPEAPRKPPQIRGLLWKLPVVVLIRIIIGILVRTVKEYLRG